MKNLEASYYQGDTTITISGGTVNVTRSGDKIEVKVNVQDSVKKEVSMELGYSH